MELSPSTITVVTAILVKARYRSTANIVSQAVCTFKRHGGAWAEAMDIAKLDALRAARRGLGPPRHTAAFPVSRLAELPRGTTPWVDQGPVGPRDTLAIGCWWLLREIELSHILREHVSWGKDIVTILLVTSKTDTEGLGVR